MTNDPGPGGKGLSNRDTPLGLHTDPQRGSPDSILEALVQAVGEDATVKIMAILGGLRLRFPKNPGDDHIISMMLGHDAASRLHDRFGHEAVEVPTMARWRHETTRRRIVEMNAEGLRTGQIAARLGMSQRGVQLALKRRAAKELLVDRDLFASAIDAPCKGD